MHNEGALTEFERYADQYTRVPPSEDGELLGVIPELGFRDIRGIQSSADHGSRWNRDSTSAGMAYNRDLRRLARDTSDSLMERMEARLSDGAYRGVEGGPPDLLNRFRGARRDYQLATPLLESAERAERSPARLFGLSDSISGSGEGPLQTIRGAAINAALREPLAWAGGRGISATRNLSRMDEVAGAAAQAQARVPGALTIPTPQERDTDPTNLQEGLEADDSDSVLLDFGYEDEAPGTGELADEEDSVLLRF